MAIEGIGNLNTPELLKNSNEAAKSGAAGGSFAQKLESALNEVNTLQNDGQKAMAGIATGQIKDLHQAALAIDKAEISMKLMLEVRNKALSAYKEISQTQI